MTKFNSENKLYLIVFKVFNIFRFLFLFFIVTKSSSKCRNPFISPFNNFTHY